MAPPKQKPDKSEQDYENEYAIRRLTDAVAVLTDVIRPFASHITTGISDALPAVPAVVTEASAVAAVPVPVPVTSPVRTNGDGLAATVAVETEVILPLASHTMTGTRFADPAVPAVVIDVNTVGTLSVPVPLTSPVRTMLDMLPDPAPVAGYSILSESHQTEVPPLKCLVSNSITIPLESVR